jgi:hypothetical protein
MSLRFMQIPAGWSRQGSAGKMTNGEWLHPVAHQGPAQRLKSATKNQARLFCGQGPFKEPFKQLFKQLQGTLMEFSSPGIEGYSELMRLYRGCTNGSLQRLGNFGNTGFLFCQRFQFTHIGRAPRAPNGLFLHGLFLLGHDGSSFYEASFYHTKKN